MAIIDVVKWNAAPGVFAWKFPSQELSTWTQLIVSESQEAVLLKEGQMVGVFGSGRHTLSTDNYPFLTSALKLVTKDSPFTAEVWFIQKAIKLDIKWGTTTPLQLEDPKYHIMLPVRAFGQYGIVIEDSGKFLFKLVGTLPAFVERTIRDYFKGIVVASAKNTIANYLIEKEISILKISKELLEISNSLEKSISEELKEYGIKVVNFKVLSISTDDNDPSVKKLKDALASRVEMDIMGFNYQQKRSFDVMETAAGNTGGSGGSILNAGIGLGMGVGMGTPMGAMASKMSRNIDTEFDSNEKTVTCPQCGKSIQADTKFCPSCGCTLLHCQKCGEANKEGTLICRKCGKGMPKKCPACGTLCDSEAKFCPSCGQKVILTCKACNSIIPTGAKFCASCGQKVEDEVSHV